MDTHDFSKTEEHQEEALDQRVQSLIRRASKFYENVSGTDLGFPQDNGNCNTTGITETFRFDGSLFEQCVVWQVCTMDEESELPDGSNVAIGYTNLVSLEKNPSRKLQTQIMVHLDPKDGPACVIETQLVLDPFEEYSTPVQVSFPNYDTARVESVLEYVDKILTKRERRGKD